MEVLVSVGGVVGYVVGGRACGMKANCQRHRVKGMFGSKPSDAQ